MKPDPLTAFMVLLGCLAIVMAILALLAAIDELWLTPWIERGGPRRLLHRLTMPLRIRAIQFRIWLVRRKA